MLVQLTCAMLLSASSISRGGSEQRVDTATMEPADAPATHTTWWTQVHHAMPADRDARQDMQRDWATEIQSIMSHNRSQRPSMGR